MNFADTDAIRKSDHEKISEQKKYHSKKIQNLLKKEAERVFIL